MKKLLLIIFLLPLMAMAQEKNITYSAVLYPKMDKIVEFEKALANHHQKYHATEWKANVFTPMTGPNAGGYMIVMGGLSWEDVDNRKPTAEHDADWNTKVLPLVNNSDNVSFIKYEKDLSTVAVGDYVEKIALFHIYPKEGKMSAVMNIIKRVKPLWVTNNSSVAVYTMESSGENQVVIVTRYRTGFKERGMKPASTLKETLGDADYTDFMSDVSENIKKSYGELMVMRKDLSSK